MLTRPNSLSNQQIIYCAESRNDDELLVELANRFESALSEVERLTQQLDQSGAQIDKLKRTASLIELRLEQVETPAFS